MKLGKETFEDYDPAFFQGSIKIFFGPDRPADTLQTQNTAGEEGADVLAISIFVSDEIRAGQEVAQMIGHQEL